MESNKHRILTGDRPTGKLHLGHWVGTLKNRVRFQNTYDCFFLIADLHSLTTYYEQTEKIGENIRELVLDYLSVGIDPEKSTLYLQSQIPKVTELFTLFAMLVSVPRLQRVPTLKTMVHDSEAQRTLEMVREAMGLDFLREENLRNRRGKFRSKSQK